MYKKWYTIIILWMTRNIKYTVLVAFIWALLNFKLLPSQAINKL